MTSLPNDTSYKPFLAWGAVGMWVLVIFLFSNQAHSGAVTEAYLGDANVPVRKFAHMFEYAVLFVLTRYAVSKSAFASGWGNVRLSLFAYLFCLGNAFFDEWHQSFVPGRSATLSDATVDMCGAMIAWVAVYLLVRIKK